MKKYKWLVAIINSTIARTTSIFLFFLALFGALEQFEIIDVAFFGGKASTYFIIIAIFSFMLALLITMLLKNLKLENDENIGSVAPTDGITRSLFNRIGSSRSLAIYYSDEMDTAHKYSSIKRYDILDYDDNHYRSIRILEGMNASKEATLSIPYCESTEYKVGFNDIIILAYDVSSGKQLKVECCHADPNEKLNTHSFRIVFSKPLEPHQHFNIAYFVSFPHELDCLSQTKEIMSISLVRIKRKVGRLSFNVFLNFKPEYVRLYSYDKSKKKETIIPEQRAVYESTCSSNVIALREDILNKFPIDKNKTFSVAGLEIPNPKSSMYIIEYSCSPSCPTNKQEEQKHEKRFNYRCNYRNRTICCQAIS